MITAEHIAKLPQEVKTIVVEFEDDRGNREESDSFELSDGFGRDKEWVNLYRGHSCSNAKVAKDINEAIEEAENKGKVAIVYGEWDGGDGTYDYIPLNGRKTSPKRHYKSTQHKKRSNIKRMIGDVPNMSKAFRKML